MVKDDGGQYGPKLLALPTERMRKFVLNLLDQGHRNYTQAYKAAGYKNDNEETCKACASRLAHDTRIQEAIFEEASRRVKGLVPLALKTVGDIMQDTNSKERGKMALSVLDRAGLHAIQETKTTVEFIGEDPQRLRRLQLMARNMGISFEKLVGHDLAKLAPPLEAEFEEVTVEPKSD